MSKNLISLTSINLINFWTLPENTYVWNFCIPSQLLYRNTQVNEFVSWNIPKDQQARLCVNFIFKVKQLCLHQTMEYVYYKTLKSSFLTLEEPCADRTIKVLHKISNRLLVSPCTLGCDDAPPISALQRLHVMGQKYYLLSACTRGAPCCCGQGAAANSFTRHIYYTNAQLFSSLFLCVTVLVTVKRPSVCSLAVFFPSVSPYSVALVPTFKHNRIVYKIQILKFLFIFF